MGLVSTLQLLHERIDAAVAEAYGWPADLTDMDSLARLVALNAERRREEATGKIRWLRPDLQAGPLTGPAQGRMNVDTDQDVPDAASIKLPWPKTLAEQVQAVRAALSRLGRQRSVEAIARQFKGAKRERVGEILEAMALMG